MYGITSLSRDEISPKQLLQKILAYWGIENGLHYRRNVTLREDRTRMSKGNTGRVMASVNNLVIGLIFTKTRYAYFLHARRFFDAHPAHAFALVTRL